PTPNTHTTRFSRWTRLPPPQLSVGVAPSGLAKLAAGDGLAGGGAVRAGQVGRWGRVGRW
ncbi:MAG: hypothetical protein ACR2P2_15045, partial [Nakamurella sp.]